MTPQRRSIRLRNYDYSWPGAYYVTIVTQQRAPLFGIIVDGEMQLNPAGQMIDQWWRELPHKFPHVDLDASVVMPNHLHGMIVIPFSVPSVRADLRVGPVIGEHTHTGEHIGSSLPTIVQWFKTMTTNEYIRGVKGLGWQPFPGKLWQRSYYEHIVRDEVDLNRIREYITNNPLKWIDDDENPAHSK